MDIPVISEGRTLINRILDPTFVQKPAFLVGLAMYFVGGGILYFGFIRNEALQWALLPPFLVWMVF